MHEAQANSSARIVASGWVCSCKLLSGGTRQIVNFQISGDFPGLRSVLFRTADHDIGPATEGAASEVMTDESTRPIWTMTVPC